MNNEKPRKTEWMSVTIVTLLIVVTGAFVYHKYIISTFNDVQAARLTTSNLQQEIRAIRQENEKLRATIQALYNNDPAAWEEATRKYLGWVKPGEVVIESRTPR
ncbi:MAG: septum formation initiator family protein [Planctomycetota bacterium]